MFQSVWVRIPVKIVLIVLVITLYFYSQHPVVYRYQDLDANIPIGDAQLLIHEIRVTNLDEDQSTARMRDEEMPWPYTLVQKMHEMGLPVDWQISFLKVISFYSWPPLADDFWTYKLYGTFISPEDIDMEKSVLDDFSLYIYPAINNNSGSQWEETLHNAVMVFAGGKIDSRQINKPLIINAVDKENDRTTRLIITPRWQKERLINRAQFNQYKSPAVPARSFMHQIYADQPQQALNHVVTELRNNFPLPAVSEQLKGQDIEIAGCVSWVDVYKGYLGVYRVEAEVGRSRENNFTPVQKLTFYTIIDQDGNHKIIDWKSAD